MQGRLVLFCCGVASEHPSISCRVECNKIETRHTNKVGHEMKSSLHPNPLLKAPTPTNLSILNTHLQRCTNLKQFHQVLSQMLLTGFIQDKFAAYKLLHFSTSSTSIHIHYSQSHNIFAILRNPTTFLCNSLIKANLQRNNPANAIRLYKSMLNNCVATDNYTHPLLLQACVAPSSLFEGKQIHGHVFKLGFTSDVYVVNTMIKMYGSCGHTGDARKVFNESPVLDLVSWRTMLAGCVQAGDVEEAKDLYNRMPERSTAASTSMIMMFSKRGEVSEAWRVFREIPDKDLVSWSALISCYERNEMAREALIVFVKMNAGGVKADEVVLVSVVSACAQLSIVGTGEMVHGFIVKSGTESFFNLQNALVHMYSSCGKLAAAEILFSGNRFDNIACNSMISGYLRCGSIEKANALFDSMPDKDAVSWELMVLGHARHDLFSETLALFQKMQLKGIAPDDIILSCTASACTHLGALNKGRSIHACIVKDGGKVDAILGTALIDLYMKFGCLENALKIFNTIDEKGVSTWNALILGLSMNGLSEKAFTEFSNMKSSGVIPDGITFIGILGACRHMGLVHEGQYHFDSMIQEHKIEPSLKHYGCMIDLLGRAGMLKEAEELINSMPMAPDVAIWGALLGACDKHGDLEMAEKFGRKLIEQQPKHDGFHVSLSNICALKGNWDAVLNVRDMMMQNKVIKTPGCSITQDAVSASPEVVKQTLCR